MALTVSQQYDRFVEFASQRNDARNQETIARATHLVDGNILKGRTIDVADDGDKIRKIKRSDALQRENDITRKLFRQAIIDIFGGEDKIPQSVKDAMRLKDYGQGKPLTVRRIMAVKAAVDVYIERAKQALESAKACAAKQDLYNEEMPVDAQKRAKIDKLLTVAVNAAVSDQDALNLVVAIEKDIIKRSGDGTLRTEEQVKERAAGILANVAELKAVAKGNQAIIDAGLDFLKLLKGKSLPQGMITTIVQTTMKQSIGAIKALSPTSSGMKLHKAVVQLFDNFSKATEAANMLGVLTENDEKNNLESFCIQLQLARLGETTARRIKTLLDSKGSLLQTLYGTISAKEINLDNVDPVIVEYMEHPCRNFIYTIDAFYTLVQAKLGTSENNVQFLQLVPEPDFNEIDGQLVAEDVLEHAEALERKERDAYLKAIVSGEGRGADMVRGRFNKALPPKVYEPLKEFKDSMNANIRGIVNRNICQMNTPNLGASRFNLDFIKRGLFGVVMPDGSNLESGDAAKDKLAAFITNGTKNTYATLDDQERKKFNVLISFLNMDVIKAGEKGGMLTLDPNGRNDEVFSFEGDLTKAQFRLSFEDNNTCLVIRCETERKLSKLYVRNNNGEIINANVKPESKLEVRYEVLIPVTELERLAEVNFQKYNDDDAQTKVNDSNVRKPYQNCQQLLGENFAFKQTVDVFSSMKMTVN